jgi:hypothetical protein
MTEATDTAEQWVKKTNGERERERGLEKHFAYRYLVMENESQPHSCVSSSTSYQKKL